MRFDAILSSLTKVQVQQMIPFVPVSEPVPRRRHARSRFWRESGGGGLGAQQTYASEAETPWTRTLAGIGPARVTNAVCWTSPEPWRSRTLSRTLLPLGLWPVALWGWFRPCGWLVSPLPLR